MNFNQQKSKSIIEISDSEDELPLAKRSRSRSTSKKRQISRSRSRSANSDILFTLGRSRSRSRSRSPIRSKKQKIMQERNPSKSRSRSQSKSSNNGVLNNNSYITISDSEDELPEKTLPVRGRSRTPVTLNESVAEKNMYPTLEFESGKFKRPHAIPRTAQKRLGRNSLLNPNMLKLGGRSFHPLYTGEGSRSRSRSRSRSPSADDTGRMVKNRHDDNFRSTSADSARHRDDSQDSVRSFIASDKSDDEDTDIALSYIRMRANPLAMGAPKEVTNYMKIKADAQKLADIQEEMEEHKSKFQNVIKKYKQNPAGPFENEENKIIDKYKLYLKLKDRPELQDFIYKKNPAYKYIDNAILNFSQKLNDPMANYSDVAFRNWQKKNVPRRK